MRVYHGSDVRINKIDLGRCEYFKDFGRGFYVTRIREHAYQRAVDVARWRNSDKPIVTEFDYVEQYPITVGMRLKKFDAPSREWVEFVMLNRDSLISHPAHTFDIVEGPIADDKMIAQIKKYENGEITIDRLVEKLTYREPTHQICFCTLASLYALKIVDNKEFRFAVDDITEAILEALIADYKMIGPDTIDALYGSKCYEQLSNADTMLWQKPWEEVYEMIRKEMGG